MPASVAAAIAAAIDVGPGDQIVLNDPFAGGTHLNDVTLVAPCHAGGRLVGWVANGPTTPTSAGWCRGPSRLRDGDLPEGLRIPPMLLTAEVAALLEANSACPGRAPGGPEGPGGRQSRRRRAARRPGRPAGGFRRGRRLRRMRAALADLPDGTWTASDVLDSTGPRPEQQRAVSIRLELTVEGSEVTFDFSRTESQQPGNVNAVAAVTASAVAWALRSATDPTIPANGGTQRPVHLVLLPAPSWPLGRRPPSGPGMWR